MRTLQLKIISDGVAAGTMVTDADGRIVQGVVSVTWSCAADEFARATLVLEGVEVDVVGQLVPAESE